MFDGFEAFDIATTGTTFHGRRGGQGPQILLLHGMPGTHLMWHRVAPQLAERFTVVATDLRGFGDSGTPPSTPDHGPYSMRELARDQVEVMHTLGYDRFSVVGHDRGARCTYRMALDHPDAVPRLAALDIVPPVRRSAARTWTSASGSGSGHSSQPRSRCPSSSSPRHPRSSSTTTG